MLCFFLLFISISINTINSAHLPNSTTEWDYGQFYLTNHTCTSNRSLTCLDYKHRETLQSPLSSLYNALHQQQSALKTSSPTDPVRATPGEWDALNKLLQNVTLSLPDFTTTIKKLVTATIHLTKLKCGGISIKNLDLVPLRPNDQNVDMTVTITGLTLKCAADWTITTNLALHGSGALTADSKGSDLSSEVVLTSPDFKHYPPTNSKDNKCTSNIVINDLEFTGGAIADILGWFKSSIISELTSTINPLLCNELSSLVDDTLASALVNISKLIDPYLTKDALLPPNIAKQEDILLNEITQDMDQHLVHLPTNFWMQNIFNLTQMFLGWNVTEQDFGINTILRNALPPNGAINITNVSAILFETDPNNPTDVIDASIVLESLAVVGLDTFDQVNLLHPYTTLNYTLLNQFSIRKLQLNIGIRIKLTPRQPIVGSNGVNGVSTIEENVHFTIGVEDLNFNTTMFLAINGDTLSTLSLGNLLKHPIDCLLNNIILANVTSLSLAIGTLTPIQVTDFVSSGLDDLADDLTESFTLAFYDSLLIALPSIAENVVRPMLNNVLHTYLSNVTCPKISIPPKGELINLLASPILIEIRTFLHDHITVDMLNGAIDTATHGQSGKWGGTIQMLGSLIGKGGVHVNIPQIGKLSLNVGNLTVSGLDTLNEYKLLDPVSRLEVTDLVKMSAPPFNPLVVLVNVGIQLVGDQVNITDTMEIGLNLTSVSIVLDTLLKLDGFWTSTMTLKDATSNLGCWAATVQDLRLIDNHTRIDIEELRLQLNCLECTSPDMNDFVQRTHNSTAQEQITSTLNAFIKRMISKLFSDQVHTETMNAFRKSANTCPQSGSGYAPAPTPETPGPPPSPPPKESGCYDQKAAVIGTASSIGLFGILFSIYYMYCHSTMKKKFNYFDQGKRTRKNQTGGNLQQLEDPLLSTVNSSASFSSSSSSSGRIGRSRLSTQDYVLRDRDIALYQHPSISPSIRYGVLISILINFGLFISGHTSVGASVDLVAHFAGDTLEYDTIYTFSLGSSLGDMWAACAILLATLIGSFSGAWPYLKLMLMTFVWMAPPRILNTRRRGGLMQILDIMGKWSLIDLYVLVMSMIAFYVQIYSPDLEILPSNFYLFSLWVTPVWGLYAFCMAVTSSLLLSHIQIVAHRNAVASDRQEVAETRRGEDIVNGRSSPSPSLSSKQQGRGRRSSWFDAGTEDLFGERKGLIIAKESVWDHVFHVENIQDVNQIGFKKRGKCMLSLLPMIGFALLIWGSIVPSFRFEINGVGGILQDFGRTNSSVIEYSMYSVMTRLLEQSNDATTTTSFVGIRCVAVLYILFSCIIPTFNFILLFVMWSIPMRLRFQKKMFFLSEVASSWSATEVYIIATVVAALEIGDISKKIIGDACDPLNPLFQILNDLGFIEKKDMLCFEVGADIQFGAYVLLAASITSIITTQIITKLTEVAIEDRENRVKGEDHDQATMTGCGHTMLTIFISNCIGCCVYKINGLNENDMTEETFQHLRTRRSSLSFARIGSESFGGGRSRGSRGSSGFNTGRKSSISSVASSDHTQSMDEENEEEDDQMLPPGWTIMMNQETKQAYYWNELNGKMTRLKPVWTRQFQTRSRNNSPQRRAPPSISENSNGFFDTFRSSSKNGVPEMVPTPRSKLGRITDVPDEEDEMNEEKKSNQRVKVTIKKVPKVEDRG